MVYFRLRHQARRVGFFRQFINKTFVRKLLIIGTSVCLIYLGGVILWAARLEIPDFSNFEERKVVQSTKIYDRTGTILLNNVNEDVRRSSIPITEISSYIQHATMAIEDREFYAHHGVRPTSIVRAFLSNTFSNTRTQGGSTITQQVVKNALLTKDKTITRKIKEVILSLKLERILPKDEILGLYLNESPYGGNMYGVEEASRVFFGKSAKDVTIAEAAYLASLPQAPTRYSPYGEHLDELEARKNLVLDKMREQGWITTEEAVKAKAEQVHFLEPQKQGIKAPHFIFYVRSYLEDKYGKDVVETEGLKVITTLDWDLQQKAEEIVAQYAAENEKNFNAHNAGVIILDPKTGNILAMVGSRDYFETANNGNFNITLAHRQPGSSFKPIVYATAFNKGYTPNTVVFDVPTQFDTSCTTGIHSGNTDTCYTPVNYDGVYRGPIALRDALAQSINIPAIKVLYLAGIKNALQTARDLGIATLGDANQYGLTLVLGGGEVSLLDLTSAYGVFANDGVRMSPQKIISIADHSSTTIEQLESTGQQVLPQNTARLISDILSDNKARAPSYGTRSPLYFEGRSVATKTGTTNDYKDAWIIGYTPDIVIGAWVGNNDNTPMEKKVAGMVVAPMWNAIMAEVLKTLPASSHFIPPDPTPTDLRPILRGIWQGGKTYLVDKISGKLATPYTPPEVTEERVITGVHSILNWINKNDPRGNTPPDLNDSQYKLWEEPVRTWAMTHGYVDQAENSITLGSDDVHLPEYIPQVTVLSPTPNSAFGPDSPVTVSISATSRFPIAEMSVGTEGLALTNTKMAPWTATFIPRTITDRDRIDSLTIDVYDSVRNKREITIPVSIMTGNAPAENVTDPQP